MLTQPGACAPPAPCHPINPLQASSPSSRCAWGPTFHMGWVGQGGGDKYYCFYSCLSPFVCLPASACFYVLCLSTSFARALLVGCALVVVCMCTLRCCFCCFCCPVCPLSLCRCQSCSYFCLAGWSISGTCFCLVVFCDAVT